MLIQDTLERTARLFPEKEGMIFTTPSPTLLKGGKGGLRFTYRQLQDRVLSLAVALNRLGIKKGDRVAALMDNSNRYFEFFFASFQIGAIAVPINHRLSVSEIEFILRDSGASVLFISDRFLSVAEDLKNRNEQIRFFIFAGEDGPSWTLDYEKLLKDIKNSPSPQSSPPKGEEAEKKSSPMRVEEVRDNITSPLWGEGKGEGHKRGFSDENDTAVILYTSGTTGSPKGVMLSHRNLLSTTTSLLFSYPLTLTDKYCNQGPMFHIGPIISMLATTISGTTHIFMDNLKPEATLETIEKEKITMIMMAPTMLHRLISHPDINYRNLNSLRLIGYGGAPMSVTILDKAQQYLKCGFLGSYGTTETAGYLTILTPDDHKKKNLLASCGREAYGVKIRIINENGGDVKNGETGEIIVKTDGLMKGYLNKPKETAKVIKEGWFYTGDVAKKDDGDYIYIVDRKKDMIITGGENVYSTEVENMLMTHDKIGEAAVIGLPDEEWGEVVTAVVVPVNGDNLTEKDIIEYCRSKLTHYKCPKSIIFKDSLPKNSSGKILKRELKSDLIK